jgi:GNAT superfamily N-acetyltransferase
MPSSRENDLVTIRSATVADAVRIAELSGVLGYPMTTETAAARLEYLLGRSEHLVLVAEITGGVAGWIHASEQSLLESGLRCEIIGLVVAATQRAKGIGRRLVGRVERWAAERGVEQLSVRSNITRSESHPFYERLGYVTTKTQHVYRKQISRNAEAAINGPDHIMLLPDKAKGRGKTTS